MSFSSTYIGLPWSKEAATSMRRSASEATHRPSIIAPSRSSAEASRSSIDFDPGEFDSSNYRFPLYSDTFRIAVIGSLNFDHIWVVPRLPQPSETLMIGKHRTTPGGKGAIQAIACARLSHTRNAGSDVGVGRFSRRADSASAPSGRRHSSMDLKKGDIKVSMIGVVGQDSAGDRIVQALYADRVDTEHIVQCREEETGRASIALGKNGENNVLVCPGANYKLTPSQIRTDLREGFPHLLILQMEIPVPTVEHLIRKAAKERIPVLLNAAPVMDEFPRELLRSVEHLIVNKLEAEDLLKQRRTEQEGNREAEIAKGRELCRSLLGMGVKYVVVTMGGHGGVAGTRQQGGELHMVDYKAAGVEKVVDTTGCGGVFIGAYAVQYIRQKFPPGKGFDIDRAVKWAAKAAALKAQSFGSLDGIPWEDELEAAA
ncbi:ribokinase [Fonsecaea erecta]|uniref:Ribokinase n=1 Tax=Fonsecaea erecta TaxID=1367422 RepID=A0A178ZCQ9_9EURO|nr:ribokinase [Fonsecaea erecta]OAP57271.1 ribokinase [Fonsecaea erecta]